MMNHICGIFNPSPLSDGMKALRHDAESDKIYPNTEIRREEEQQQYGVFRI